MAGYSRDCRVRVARASPRGFECVSLGLPPPSLLDQLVCDLQNHLDEMERLRSGLMDAYPRLSSRQGSSGGGSVSCSRSGSSTGFPRLEQSDDGRTYCLCLDVGCFAADELAVKLEGLKLAVSGRHDQRTQSTDGCVCHEVREMRKELLLPDDVNLDALSCCLIPEVGRLRIEAPRQESACMEKTIAIAICRVETGRSPPAAEKRMSRCSSPERGAAL